jgi:hypothetical protein
MTNPTYVARPRVRISPLAPGYYMGHPAHVWIEACRPGRRTNGASYVVRPPTADTDESEGRTSAEQLPANPDDLCPTVAGKSRADSWPKPSVTDIGAYGATNRLKITGCHDDGARTGPHAGGHEQSHQPPRDRC